MDVSGIFYFFSAQGGEGGVWGDREGGGWFLLKISQEGGGSPGGGGGGRERGIWGGGAKYFFFRGQNARQVNLPHHSDLLWRPPPAPTQFSWVSQACLPLKRGSQRSKYGGGGSKKHYGAVIHYPVVILVRQGHVSSLYF